MDNIILQLLEWYITEEEYQDKVVINKYCMIVKMACDWEENWNERESKLMRDFMNLTPDERRNKLNTISCLIK